MASKKVNRSVGFHLHKRSSKYIVDRNKKRTLVPGEWYFILISTNGRTVMRSTNMYNSKQGAIRGIKSAIKVVQTDAPDLYYDHTGIGEFFNPNLVCL